MMASQSGAMITQIENRNHRLFIERLHLLTLRLKYHNAASRVMHLASKAGFHPDQPRVPRGDPDGGQWTLVGGRDGLPIPRRLVDLHVHESIGGHAIRDHVGKSVSYLVRRLFEKQADDGYRSYFIQIAGSFPSVEAANKLVNSTLSQSWDSVEAVKSNKYGGGAIIYKIFPSKTGIEAYLPVSLPERIYNMRPSAEPEIRDTYGVKVVIKFNPNSPDGFSVITAFPFNKGE